MVMKLERGIVYCLLYFHYLVSIFGQLFIFCLFFITPVILLPITYGFYLQEIQLYRKIVPTYPVLSIKDWIYTKFNEYKPDFHCYADEMFNMVYHTRREI